MLQFGGFDVVINTAAIYPTPDPSDAGRSRRGRKTLQINVTSNYVLAQEAAQVLKAQNLPASIVLTSSANAVVPEGGQRGVRRQQGGDQSPDPRAGHRPRPAGPRERHRAGHGRSRDRRCSRATASSWRCKKYNIAFDESESTEDLRDKLAEFYARRTITRRPILPIDNANAICWLAGDQSAKTTGHVIPVDGGLPEAFLR